MKTRITTDYRNGASRIIKRSHVTIILCSLLLVFFVFVFAAGYLSYADALIQSDAVILFIGPGLEARQREAYELLRSGYADVVIVPAYRRILRLSDLGPASAEKLSATKNYSAIRMIYPRFYEDTHSEILEAKKMIDSLGYRNHIFVSSPAHIRRIRIVAARVFMTASKRNYHIVFVPTRYEESPSLAWLGNGNRLKQVVDECVKILWFLCYSPFAEEANT